MRTPIGWLRNMVETNNSAPIGDTCSEELIHEDIYLIEVQKCIGGDDAPSTVLQTDEHKNIINADVVKLAREIC